MRRTQSIDENQNIVSAQIVKLKHNKIYLKTEQGKQIIVEYPQSQQKSSKIAALFSKTLRDIWRNHLWIPVDTKNHHLLQYDWLS